MTVLKTIQAAAGARRPSMGTLECPWCRGLLFFCLSRRDRLTLSCTTAGCAESHQAELNAGPQQEFGWTAHSVPQEKD